jgi:hypothetical protein
MKRTLFDLLLVIALGAAAAFGWMRYQAGAGVAAQVAELTPKTAGAVTKLAESEKALQELQDELAPLREQAQQLSAYKSAFANGRSAPSVSWVWGLCACSARTAPTRLRSMPLGRRSIRPTGVRANR